LKLITTQAISMLHRQYPHSTVFHGVETVLLIKVKPPL